MVFQHFGPFPWKPVDENIACGLSLQGRSQAEIKDAVDHYIHMVGLAGFEKSYPYQLSGGMLQRVVGRGRSPSIKCS